MNKIEFTMKGSVPLMISSDHSANPLHPVAKEIKKLTGVRKKTDDLHEEILKLKWMACLYLDKDLGIYMPVANVWRSIHDAAKMSKSGKDIERGVQAPPVIGFKIIHTGGTNDPEKLYQNSEFIDVRMARPNGTGGKIPVARPIFREWSINASMMYDTDIIDEGRMRDFITMAGRYCGVGTYRRFFGRFDVDFK